MSIRPVQPESDFPHIVALINVVEPEPVTLAQFQQWHAHMPLGRICRRMVATDERDEAIGYSAAVHESWSPARHFYVWVTVDPQRRGQGVGSALYADAQAFLESQGAISLTSEVRDDCPASLRFAERRGFSVEGHQFESTLDLAAFGETPYQGVIPALEAAGMRFFSMADLGDSQAARLKLYALNHATSLDVPGANAVDMPFSEFEQWVLGAEWYRPDGQLIAADGETWVGLAAVQLLPQSQGAYNLMTGVIRPYRGRRIALALKLKAIRYARAHGARTLRTHNDSLNAPMLAINRKLGYRPQPGKYILRCDAMPGRG
jgi:GNAT superfamily N-acetyltransferase